MAFAPGSLVRARGRDWVVLPGSADDLVVVRPLGGTDEEVTAILAGLEEVAAAEFAAPDPADAGNAVSAGLLRTALQIGFRSTAGPFRCVAGLAVEPRAYQLVPLLLALRQRVTRLLIADDVGVGKTVEAGLVAAELLAQGSIRGFAVLCSPALAEQWQAELAGKFRIDAELVLSSTVGRLARGLLDDESLFERHPVTIVSTDLIKSPRHRADFARACPDLVIVDEAHSCVADGSGGGAGASQRYDLLRTVAADRDRHVVLVTATPHSGKDEGFRNLIGLLDPRLATADLTQRTGREHLARHMVQRRRGDIRRFLDENTPFPEERLTQDVSYHLTPGYAALLRDVMAYAQETVRDAAGEPLHGRVRYWSALALLRALASSPRAAAATLRTRARTLAAADPEQADGIGRATVLDADDGEADGALDVTPGADPDAAPGSRERARLRAFAARADALEGAEDAKLTALTETVQAQLLDGYDPVVFCRFIDTAEYVTGHLRAALGRSAQVAAVTGLLPPAEREARIAELTATNARHVLVATDCLSEGVNLQEHFQAVIHYDLAWNPTRHEQREGRVDRFGQRRSQVRAVTVVGADNRIDAVVMRVLLRKHREIRSQLGISVPVPNAANQVVEAVLEELLDGHPIDPAQEALFSVDDLAPGSRAALHREWESSAATEKESRTKFAQAGIKPDDVAREVAAMREALGVTADVTAFTREALDALGAPVAATGDGFAAQTAALPAALRDALPPGKAEPLTFRTELPVPRAHAHLDRTDASVTAVARHVLDTALDPLAPGPRPARRCGVVRTDAVQRRTTLLVARFRFTITLPSGGARRDVVAEDAALLAFRGRTGEPQWLEPDEVAGLLAAVPSGNVERDLAVDDLARAVDGLAAVQPHLGEEARVRAERLREAHTRVREAGRSVAATTVAVRAHLPVDVLGLYLYLPAVRP